jgi:hypothetical protein
MSVQSRAQFKLTATITAEPAKVLATIKEAAGAVKGGGVSLLTTGVANVGATVHVERETADGLSLSITSGKRLVELCTFSAKVSVNGSSCTVQVGGLDRYKTSQSRIFGFIPSGPKMILGYDPYKRFLSEVENRLRALDPTVNVTVASPVSA